MLIFFIRISEGIATNTTNLLPVRLGHGNDIFIFSVNTNTFNQ